MLRNDIEYDVKAKLLEARLTQAELGAKIGSSGQHINRVVKSNVHIVNNTFVKMMDTMGYDIVLTYEKRK